MLARSHTSSSSANVAPTCPATAKEMRTHVRFPVFGRRTDGKVSGENGHNRGAGSRRSLGVGSGTDNTLHGLLGALTAVTCGGLFLRSYWHEKVSGGQGASWRRTLCPGVDEAQLRPLGPTRRRPRWAAHLPALHLLTAFLSPEPSQHVRCRRIPGPALLRRPRMQVSRQAFCSVRSLWRTTPARSPPLPCRDAQEGLGSGALTLSPRQTWLHSEQPANQTPVTYPALQHRRLHGNHLAPGDRKANTCEQSSQIVKGHTHTATRACHTVGSVHVRCSPQRKAHTTRPTVNRSRN